MSPPELCSHLQHRTWLCSPEEINTQAIGRLHADGNPTPEARSSGQTVAEVVPLHVLLVFL